MINFYDLMLQLETVRWPKPTLSRYDHMDVMSDYAQEKGNAAGRDDYIKYFASVFQEIEKRIGNAVRAETQETNHSQGNTEAYLMELENMMTLAQELHEKWTKVSGRDRQQTQQLLKQLDDYVEFFKSEDNRGMLFRSGRKKSLAMLEQLLQYVEYVRPYLQRVIES